MFSDKTIEEYQVILMRSPSSKVFAPLAEAYRKMGLLQQALEICEKGIKYNPDYPSGLVAYGKVLFETKKYNEAAGIFQRATDLKSDNILAYKLKALSLIKLNKYSEALDSYKRVLFLNPQDEQAKKFVENWEYIEAPKYSAATFATAPEQDQELLSDSSPSHVAHFIEALMARNEIDRARQITQTSLEIWPDNAQLKKQLQILNEFIDEETVFYQRQSLETNQIKKQFLKKLLRRIELVKSVDQ
jgi:tetratricopeptide (TPR) repeat protein